jgi:hypothetical protein
MLKLTLHDIAQQTLTQAFKICLRDFSCTQLDGKRVLGFNNAKAGDIVTRTALLDEPRDFYRPIFWVVILHQGTRVEERVGHLALITLSSHDVRHCTMNLRQAPTHLLKALGIAGLLGTPLCELWIEQVFLYFAIFSNRDCDALMLFQSERLQRTKHTVFINGLNRFAHHHPLAASLIAFERDRFKLS